jgi:hypothetical protein
MSHVYSHTKLNDAVSQPSAQVLAGIQAAAFKTLDACWDPADAYELLAATLLGLGYRPPADGMKHWETLLERLAGLARWSDGMPRWDEMSVTEGDWQRMIRDELTAIAGRPL